MKNEKCTKHDYEACTLKCDTKKIIIDKMLDIIKDNVGEEASILDVLGLVNTLGISIMFGVSDDDPKNFKEVSDTYRKIVSDTIIATHGLLIAKQALKNMPSGLVDSFFKSMEEGSNEGNASDLQQGSES